MRPGTPEDVVAAGLWFVVIVPPAFGFWLVAGDLAGVPAAEFRPLIVASMLGVGIATLAQVVAGYRLPVFEGPAGNYLAAVAVLAVASPTPAQATGGLLAAAALVVALGAAGADRFFERLFTPAVVHAFLLIIVIVALPPTTERALGTSSGAPLGTSAGWLATGAVVAVAAGAQLAARLRPYALLLALVTGVAVYFAVDGVPSLELSGVGIAVPELFPWGPPELTASVAAPFLVAGVLASFNTVASIRVISDVADERPQPQAGRRGLLAHGGTLGIGACLGNVLGHVPRLDSSSVVRLIGNPRRMALGLAAALIIVLAFVGPVIDVLAQLPVPVSGALLLVVLGLLANQGLRAVAAMDARSRWLVIAPAVAPAFVWLALADRMSQTAQLLTNPLLVGVVLAVALDHVLPAHREGGTWKRN